MLHSASIGLDVHARSISAAAFAFGTGGAVQRTFGYGPDAVAAWAATLPQPAGCLYESGPSGFDLQGRLVALGLPCHAGAVSKMVRPSGDRVKTDRRDAHLLSRLLAVGELVECTPPTPAMEAARANRRTRRRYLDLGARGKGANVAIARELVGFCWALALCGRAAELRNHPPARAARPRRAGHPAIRPCAARPGLATRDPRPAELPSRSVGMR